MSFLQKWIAIFRNRLQELNIFIFILSILFGISSWVVFAGVLVEAPLLIKNLPEGWALPSIIGAVGQLGQIGPILLYFLKCQMFSCCPGRFLQIRYKRVPDRVIIYSLFGIGLVSLIAIALFWNKTIFIFSKQRSVPFFTGVFFLAILDCTCTIVFLTYIGKFKQNYVTALYIGEGISSLIPSLLALAQGTGDEAHCHNKTTNATILSLFNNHTLQNSIDGQANFSVSVYFWLLFVILMISFIAFILLDWLPCFRKERTRKNDAENDEDEGPELEDFIAETSIKNNSNKQKIILKQREKPSKPVIRYDKKGKTYLLIAITIVSFFLYGLIPGLSSYSALPYGARIMHLSLTFALITQPISSLVATFLQLKTIKNVYILLAVSFGITVYIVSMSWLSPCPILINHWSGGVLMIAAWVVVYALLMYLRCCITSLLKKRYGEKPLMICGLLTQVGQFAGSILIYVVIDIVELFKEADPCNDNMCYQT